MRKSVLLITFIFLIGNTLFAQVFRFGVPNLEAYDKQLFHFGFSLGIDIVDANLKTLENYSSTKNSWNQYEIKEIYSAPVPAFNVGIVSNLRLGEFFDLRFIPAFSIAHNMNLYYQIIDHNSPKETPDLILKEIEGHYVNLPLFIKFKSSRMHNVRMYVLAGGQIGINVMQEKIINYGHPLEDVVPITKPYDVHVKGGFGFDFYTTYFKLSTEFHVSFGVMNMLKDPMDIKNPEQRHKDYYANSPIYQGIQSLKSKTFTISIIIE